MNGEGRHRHLPCSLPSLWDSWPGKERHDGARMTQLIPIIQVVGPWVVKVDRQFHQPQTQHPGVEIDIALRVAGNRRHVMNAENFFTHSLSPFPPSCKVYVKKAFR